MAVKVFIVIVRLGGRTLCGGGVHPFLENYSFTLSIMANDHQMTDMSCPPGQFDGVYPGLALGDGVRPQLVLALVLPAVHDPEAHGLLLPVRLLGSVRISSGGQESLAVTALMRERVLVLFTERIKFSFNDNNIF